MGIPLTDQIAEIIEQMLRENGGELELQRNKLAGKVGCVPSQINYVITSRFNADRGYIVESRRGGGGYIKITKVSFDSKNTFIAHVISAIGSGIDFADSKALMYALYEKVSALPAVKVYEPEAHDKRQYDVCRKGYANT